MKADEFKKLLPVYSLFELRIGDKIVMQFAHCYSSKRGWSEFTESDYIVSEINEAYIKLRSCEFEDVSYKLYNIGSKNSYGWVKGKYIN